jgi:hypothetical protein
MNCRGLPKMKQRRSGQIGQPFALQFILAAQLVLPPRPQL